MSLPTDYRYTQDRELSWLKFNERVLAEARDESVPLMERLKFAAIFTSNLDEFFMVRVGSITDMALVKEEHIDNKSGRTPQQQLEAIFKAVPPLYKQRDKVFDQLDLRLRSCNICRLSMEQLDSKARKQAESWFQSQVRPILSPLVVDLHHPFPHLPNKGLAVALCLKRDGRDSFGFLPVPTSLPPFLRLEERGLIITEPTEVITKSSGRRNGNLLFSLRAIGEAIDEHYDRQLAELELAAERQRVANLLRKREPPT